MLRKYRLILVFVSFGVGLQAQSYTMAIDEESLSYGPHMEFVQPLLGVHRLADLNNDGLDDLLIMGKKNYSIHMPRYFKSFYVYLRDSTGHFKEPQLVVDDFERLYSEDGEEEPIMEIGDIDGDGDLDVLTYSTRRANQAHSFLAFYVNDGTGHLSLDTSQTFSNVKLADLGDVDNDGSADVLILDKSYNVHLYRNNGMAQFTLDTINFFNRIKGPLSFQDLNGDGLDDIYHLGMLLGGALTVDTNVIYLSQSDGSFITSSISNLAPDFSFNIIPTYKFMNLDSDNDLDYLTVYHGGFSSRTVIEFYENDGFGSFTKKAGRIELPSMYIDGLKPESNGLSLQVADFIGDSRQDLLFTGRANIYSDTVKPRLFENKGWGHLELVAESPFSTYHSYRTAIGDVNGDGRKDIVYVSDLMRPRGDGIEIDLFLGQFNGVPKKTGYPFQNMCKANLESIDIDMDGDLDLLTSGEYAGQLDSMLVFLNNGLGAFSKSPDTLVNIKALNLSYTTGDWDNDGDQDILRVFQKKHRGIFHTEWLQNDGAGNFMLLQGNLPYFNSSTPLLLEDFDGNGHLDLLVNGVLGINGENYHLFLNSGSLSFHQDSTWNEPTPDYLRSADMDNDGDIDVIYSRGSALFGIVNNGAGKFDTTIGIQPISYSTYSRNADFILEDINGDSLIDILYLGHPLQNGTFIYRNDGNNNFSVISDSLKDFVDASGTFIDFDGDNSRELVLSGFLYPNGNYQRYSEIYKVDTNFNFTLVSDSLLYAVAHGSYVSADFDSDGDEDLFYSGISPEFARSCFYYRNKLFSGLSTPTFIPAPKNNERIAVYPNPSSGAFTVQLPSQKLGDIRIFTLQGQLMHHSTGVNSLHGEYNFPDGIYIVQVELDGKQESFKLWIVN